jgi:type IV pilus assembly protein PilQ
LLSANKSFSRELGNQLGILIGNRGGNVLTGIPGPGSPFTRTPPPRATSGGAGTPLIANFPAAATAGLSFLIQAGGDVILDEIIGVAEARGTAKLISRPKVTTQNNQAATISQGTQIPVQTNVNNTISVQFLNFSLQLQVTPQITEAGTILLTTAIENSQPDFARAVNGVPSVATQRANTQVLIPDGGTAVIGGILVDSDSVNVRQIPGLGSIPIVGNLFKNTSTIKSTAELIFFITPRIKNPESIAVVDPAALEGTVAPQQR